jgi:hypothetical protein
MGTGSPNEILLKETGVDRSNIRMYEEHLKTCGYCQRSDRATKLAKLGHIIKGTKAASSVTTTRSYSNTNATDQLKKAKLRELGNMIKGL